jgi:hypothetical protein
MTSLSTGPVRRWRRFAGLFAVLLAFASVIPTHAISSAGIANANFGNLGNCNLNSWTALGAVSVAETNFGGTATCAATINAFATTPIDASTIGDISIGAGEGDGSDAIHSTELTSMGSMLTQRFVVNPNNSVLMFYLFPWTDNPSTSFAAETISLLNSSGQRIYSKSRNSALTSNSSIAAYKFEYNLAAYANQYVTLEVSTYVSSGSSSSPTSVSLTVDFDVPGSAEGKLPNPGVPVGEW